MTPTPELVTGLIERVARAISAAAYEAMRAQGFSGGWDHDEFGRAIANAAINAMPRGSDELGKAVRSFQNADTEYRRAKYTGEQPRLSNAGTRYVVAKHRIFKALAALNTEAARSGEGELRTFQAGVDAWMDACFTPAIKADVQERSDRFIEEALEFVQAAGYSAERAHALVDYTFGRPQGEVNQEVGGVMVTLAAMCNTLGIEIGSAAATELARVWTKIDVIRAKQAAKPTGSALPISAALSTPLEARDAATAARIMGDGITRAAKLSTTPLMGSGDE